MTLNKIILLLALWFPLGAVTKDVCASGCDYNNFQTALTATASDCTIDVLEVKAGETFSGNFKVPYRDCTTTVWVRSSRYTDLPSIGTRVSETDEALMPTLSANVVDTGALWFTARESNDMNGADLATNIMTLGTAFATGTAFSCSNTPPPPMEQGVIYYAINVSPTTMQAALTPGGAAIDITGPGSTGAVSYYARPQCLEVAPRKNWRFTGIKVTVPVGVDMSVALVLVGNLESNPLSVPRNIWFDRCIVRGHGDISQAGPNGGFQINGANVTISDSRITDIFDFGNAETKPIFGWGSPGPLLVQNNYISGGSIGILLGGAKSAIPGQVYSDATIRNNYIVTPGEQMYRQGSGAPTGTGYYGQGSGEFYLRTDIVGATCATANRCYVAQPDGSWLASTSEPIRTDDFLLKNRIEFKECNRCLVEGNVIEGNQESVDSQGNCILVVALNPEADRYIRDTTVRDNRCIDTWGSINVSSYSNLTRASYNVFIQNNLTTGMGAESLIGADGGTNDSIFQVRLPKWQNLQFWNNTFRPATSPVAGTAYGIFTEDDTVGLQPFDRPDVVLNNIFWYGTAGSRTASSTTTCNLTTSGWGANFLNTEVNVSANVQFGGTSLGGLNLCATVANLSAVAAEATVDFASDNSLNPTSPYSASCASGCSFVGTNGADVGVDLPRLNAAIDGVTTGTRGMAVSIVPGSVGAIAQYTAPNNLACSIKLYTNVSRTTLSADTDSGAEQVDSRTGSVTIGTSRQLVLGSFSALTASTPYWLTINCGGTTNQYTFSTLEAGSGTTNVVTQYSVAVSGEYSSSADMSSPTAISSSTTHTVPVPTGSVRYYRYTNGPVRALIAK